MQQQAPKSIDWAAAREFLAETVRRRWYHDASVVDDIVQECLVRLLRASRRNPIDNIEALMTEIAKRAIIDKLRSNTRASAVFGEASEFEMEKAAATTPAPDQFGDPVSRIRFVVLNVFGATNCADLARAYFEQLNWDHVATELGTSHAAIRKQWQRCVERLRALAERSPELAELADWAQA